MNAQTTSTPTQQQIAMRAYEIWKEAGYPEGNDMEHWQQAERELCAKQAALTRQPSMMMGNNGRKNRASRPRAEASV